MLYSLVSILDFIVALVSPSLPSLFSLVVVPPPPHLTPSDSHCSLYGKGVGMVGSEDLAMGRHSTLFITSGDLHTCFAQGSQAANPGGIWIMDLRPGAERQPRKVPIEGLPEGRRFQPHGFDVSNSTDRMFVISHNGDHTSIDIFSIKYSTSCLGSLPWSCPHPVTLSFIKSITSPLFLRYGLNDVVEAGDNELYVTEWQPYGFPEKGKKNPATWEEYLHGKLEMPINFLGLKTTRVFHCKWASQDDDAKCAPATEERFIGANGMTMSGDGDTVFVNDPVAKRVSVMKRDKDSGSLTLHHHINLPVPADQVEYDDESGEILVGTISAPLGNIVRGRSGLEMPISGGMLVLRRVGDVAWEVDYVLEHDGVKLPQISASARFGELKVLGSPFSEGILVCEEKSL